MKSRSFTFGEQTAAWKKRQKATRENTVRSNQFHPDKSRQRVCWTLICGQDGHRVPFLWPCPAFLRLSISSVHQIHTLTQCRNTQRVLFPDLFFVILPLSAVWDPYPAMRNCAEKSPAALRMVVSLSLSVWHKMKYHDSHLRNDCESDKVVFRGWSLLTCRGPSHKCVVH